ncbi:MAG TPA: SigE family RNA polymerase sigma factor [Kineosporiaceae bacterium]|nr:SigE family RNA polymerase sigma factor [Kineosporiaceae bacterium]
MTVTVVQDLASLHARRQVRLAGCPREVSVHGAAGDVGPDTTPEPVARLSLVGSPQLSALDADQAITVLYNLHWNRLVRLATLLTRDASIAEEIVQDAFVSLHRRWPSLTERAAAHGYLRTSVVNGARSAMRHRGVEERYRQPGPPDPPGPEEHAVRATEDAQVMAALRTLSRRQQEVLVLRYYGDYSEQDIAATLGLSKGAVKSHAHRALAALRQALTADQAGR